MELVTSSSRAAILALCLGVPGVAWAGDLSFVVTNANASVTSGFGATSLPELARQSVADPMSALLTEVCGPSCAAPGPVFDMGPSATLAEGRGTWP